MVSPQKLINSLVEKKFTLALAESMTCGLAAFKLSGCIGTSDVLKGGIVCYSPEVKKQVLKVPSKLMDEFTCESMEVTEALAKKLHGLIPADICASITGLASPGGSETKEKPVGTVFFCVYHNKKMYRLRKLYRGNPLQIKRKACKELWEFILAVV